MRRAIADYLAELPYALDPADRIFRGSRGGPLDARTVQRRMESLRGALEGKSHALTDVSDMRAVLRISGDATRMVLAKCCPIDVFAEDFRPGFVRRLSFGEIAAAIHVVSAEPVTVDLYVFRSYADYALDWLTEAAGPGRAVALFGKTEAPKI